VREVLGLREVEVPTGARSLATILEEQERELIRAELERSGGVIARAARALGLERTTLTRRLRQLGLRGVGKAS
jgi:DNA-binding NtrC family response regulator